MNFFEHATQQPVNDFLRDVGISLKTFLMILEKITTYSVAKQERSPMEKRGRKFGLPLTDRLLLIFRYSRHSKKLKKGLSLLKIKKYNRELAKERIFIEPINRTMQNY